jgi:hypothetical protein
MQQPQIIVAEVSASADVCEVQVIRYCLVWNNLSIPHICKSYNDVSYTKNCTYIFDIAVDSAKYVAGNLSFHAKAVPNNATRAILKGDLVNFLYHSKPIDVGTSANLQAQLSNIPLAVTAGDLNFKNRSFLSLNSSVNFTFIDTSATVKIGNASWNVSVSSVADWNTGIYYNTEMNASGYLCLVLTAGGPTEAVCDANDIGLWHMNGTNPTVLEPDSCEPVHDVTMTNDSMFYSFGRFYNSAHFAGADWGDVVLGPDFLITIDFYVFPETTGDTRYLFGSYSGGLPHNPSIFRNPDGSIQGVVGGLNIDATVRKAPMGSWTHVGLQLNEASAYQWFINGSADTFGVPPACSGGVGCLGQTYIGDVIAGSGIEFKGYIDDFRIRHGIQTMPDVNGSGSYPASGSWYSNIFATNETPNGINTILWEYLNASVTPAYGSNYTFDVKAYDTNPVLSTWLNGTPNQSLPITLNQYGVNALVGITIVGDGSNSVCIKNFSLQYNVSPSTMYQMIIGISALANSIYTETHSTRQEVNMLPLLLLLFGLMALAEYSKMPPLLSGLTMLCCGFLWLDWMVLNPISTLIPVDELTKTMFIALGVLFFVRIGYYTRKK